MTFPLIYFLYIYYAFLVLWAFFGFVVVFHMVKYGFKNLNNFFITLIFIVVGAALVLVSFYFIDQIDWETRVSIFKNFSNSLEY